MVARCGRLACGALAAALALGSAPARAQDDLGGFEEDDDFEVEIDGDAPLVPDRWWEVDGSLGVSSSIAYLAHEAADGTGYTGLTRLRTRLSLELDADLPLEGWTLRVSPYVWYDWAYLIEGRHRFTDRVLAEYEWEVDFQESYIEGPLLENLDLKLGRQVVNWGRSDSVRVLDVLNPLDNREPGRADIEDLRWAIGMAKLDYYWRNWTVTAIAIPEMRFDSLPAWGNDFNPSPVRPPPVREPDSFREWDAAAAVRGIFEGWDVSFHFARHFNDFPRLSEGQQAPTATNPAGFVLVHDRLYLAGVGGNFTTGAWLFKSEAAWIDGLGFAFVSGEKSRFDVMLGVEYYGFGEATVALEVVERHLFDYERAMRLAPNEVRQDTITYALRYTGEWLNDRLSTTVLAIANGTKLQDGLVLRLQGDYDIRDGLVLTAGVLIFQAGNLPPLDDWGRNDRIFFDLKWSF